MHESAALIDTYLPSGPEARVEVYLRSLAPTAGHDRQTNCLRRLNQLEASAAVASVSAHVWGDSICTRTPEIAGLDNVLKRVGEIYSFSADHDAIISPFFRVTRIEASISGESFERIVPPRCTLLCYDGSSLVGVFPCLVEGESLTPLDAIERLESRVGLDRRETVELNLPPD